MAKAAYMPLCSKRRIFLTCDSNRHVRKISVFFPRTCIEVNNDARRQMFTTHHLQNTPLCPCRGVFSAFSPLCQLSVRSFLLFTFRLYVRVVLRHNSENSGTSADWGISSSSSPSHQSAGPSLNVRCILEIQVKKQGVLASIQCRCGGEKCRCFPSKLSAECIQLVE